MERITITHSPSGFAIEGCPDAVKALKLSGPLATRLSHIWLHKIDLDFAADAIEQINSIPLDFRVAREGLWRSAVVHYTKCFGASKSRFQLSAAKLFQNDANAKTVHQFFMDLRNKHIVHDENAFSMCVPTALINDGKNRLKVEKIVCIASFIQTLDQPNWSNLKVLVGKTHSWVESEFDRICDKITVELEIKSHEELQGLGQATVRVPSTSEVGGTRDAS